MRRKQNVKRDVRFEAISSVTEYAQREKSVSIVLISNAALNIGSRKSYGQTGIITGLELMYSGNERT